MIDKNKKEFFEFFGIEPDFYDDCENFTKRDFESFHDYYFYDASQKYEKDDYDLDDLENEYLNYLSTHKLINLEEYVHDYYRFINRDMQRESDSYVRMVSEESHYW